MPAPSSSPSAGFPARPLTAAALIAFAALLAWHNSFEVPFVLDDLYNIEGNASLRRLGAVGEVFAPPSDIGVGGRPILNLSFALNYALSRHAVTSYHALNLAIHILAGLTLLGLVRRTLLALSRSNGVSTRLAERFARDALALATTAALLWTLHPVQTASVTYLSQRAESLMGLFYLLTLYCFTRGATCHPSGDNSPVSPSDDPATCNVIRHKFPGERLAWLAIAVVSCALGMLTKEVMVTAPVAVLLYDRTFVAGSFRAALAQRRWFYLALAATWLPLPFVMSSAAERGVGTSRGVDGFTYALTETRAVLNYVRLSVWPDPLIFDHGTRFLKTFADAAPYVLGLVPLFAATVFAVVRWRVAGFLPAWFFLILAPTSSVVPVAFMPFAENRLYLPLAAVAVAAALGFHALTGRRVLLAALAPALLCGWLAEKRNRDYRSELALWSDAVAKCPDNPQARYNLGLVLSREGRHAAAAAQWRAALRDEPVHPPAHENLANALVTLGRVGEALPHYEEALRQYPNFPVARANYGLVLLYLGRVDDAELQLRLAVKQAPTNPGALTNYGLVLERLGRGAEAVANYEAALRLDPNFADARHNLGVALMRAGRTGEALVHFEAVARARPNSLDAQLNLARGYLQAERLRDAHARASTALAQFPKAPEAHLLMGNVLALMGQLPAAAVEYERALELKPDFADARQNLAQIRARLPR